MLVIEGPDGAGKTHLAERLHKDLHIPIQPKVVSSDAQPLVDLREWVDANLSRMRRMKDHAIPHIFDRHRLISELIYGPVLRTELEEGFEDMDWLSGSLLEFYSARPVLICALPPWGTIYSNLAKTKQPSLVVQNWKQIYWGYHCWAAHHRRLITLWDYTKDKYPVLLAEIRYRLARDWNWTEKSRATDLPLDERPKVEI